MGGGGDRSRFDGALGLVAIHHVEQRAREHVGSHSRKRPQGKGDAQGGNGRLGLRRGLRGDMGKKRHGEAYATGNTHGDCAVSMLFGSHDRLLMLRIVGATAWGRKRICALALAGITKNGCVGPFIQATDSGLIHLRFPSRTLHVLCENPLFKARILGNATLICGIRQPHGCNAALRGRNLGM